MGQKISFFKENTTNIDLAFKDVDLTGATIYFTIKPQFDDDQTDSNAIIKKDITSHVNPSAGLSRITLTPTDTSVEAGTYGYDIKLKKSDGQQSTITVGDCEIKDAYTLRG
jgi:hypothetical protein